MRTKKPQDLLKSKYRQICNELEKLPSAERTPFKTNGVVQSEKISSVKSIEKLIELHSHILGRYNAYKNSVELLDVNSEPYKYGGFTIEDWTHDFKIQIEILKAETRTIELTEAKKAA